MYNIACCLVIGSGLGLGLDSASGLLVVMHTYLCYFICSVLTKRTDLQAGS